MLRMIQERNRYLAAAVGTALFAAVYECFSHQVWSGFMIFAFLFPLLGGALPFTLLLKGDYRAVLPGTVSRCLYNSGIAALTAGSIFQGILEIYGTTNRLSSVYWITGTLLLLLGLLLYRAERTLQPK